MYTDCGCHFFVCFLDFSKALVQLLVLSTDVILYSYVFSFSVLYVNICVYFYAL